MSQKLYLIVNFGGPRNLQEVESFLYSLLTDKEVIRTNFPQIFHNFLFGRIAKKRAKKIVEDYAKIGGKSPIWSDTEYVADELRKRVRAPVLTFHRYLPSTHHLFLKEISQVRYDEVLIFPMFPQFTYATTGSAALFFKNHLSPYALQKFRWIKSYPVHPAYIHSVVKIIRKFLDDTGLSEEKIFFLFSAHGLPKSFIDDGDLYEYECRASYEQVLKHFPLTEGILCYQSKFGKGEWLRPYTSDVCEDIEAYARDRKYCVFVPISFTSDHIETLFEVEYQYMPIITNKGYHAFRVPALNRSPEWMNAVADILSSSTPCSTSMLLRR
jgi:protoporphyrin/coproporphyrin ferrochelatase